MGPSERYQRSGRRIPLSDAGKPSSGRSPNVGIGPLRSIPFFVWLAAFTMFALVLLGTLILPQLLIPDEKHHADMVLMTQEGTWIEAGWPGPGERRLDPAIVAASLSLGPRERALRENRAAQHPPLFYLMSAATSSLVTLTADEPDLVLDLWSYRLVSVLAAAALPITFYLVSAELTTNRWIRLASTVVPLAIPGITLRVGPMINTDALLILLTSLSVLFAVRVAKGDLTWRTGVGLGITTGLAALTKGHALVVIPVIAAAYLVRIFRDRRISREWLRSVALSGGISLVLGGWWWIRNLVAYGAIQPLGQIQPRTEPVLDWTEWLAGATERVVDGFWGGGFALRGSTYMTFFWILTILLVVGCVVGWVRSEDRTASSISGLFVLLLIPAVFMTSALFYAERGEIRGIQGRYFYPGLAGIAPLVVLAVAGLGRRATRWLPTLLVSGSLAMTVLAIRYMFDRYWSSFGPDWGDRWSGVVATSPFPGVIPIGILVLTIGALLALLVSAVFLGVRGDTRSSLTSTPRIESEWSA